MLNRRGFLGSACAAVAVALTTPSTASARRPRAPRVTCPHTGCRYHRPDSVAPGICALSIDGVVAYPDEVLP